MCLKYRYPINPAATVPKVASATSIELIISLFPLKGAKMELRKFCHQDNLFCTLICRDAGATLHPDEAGATVTLWVPLVR